MAGIGLQPRLPTFDPRAAMQLYLAGRYAEASALFLEHWQFLDVNTFSRVDAAAQAYIDTLVPTFLYVFTQPDFLIPPEHYIAYINCNRVISNIVALSTLRTTDGHLELIRNQQANFVRILTLFSARNTVAFDRTMLCDFNADLASFWYVQYGCLCASGLVNETVRTNLIAHFNFTHPGLVYPKALQNIYFGCTYVDGLCDRPLKTAINETLRRLAPPPATNPRNPRKIAVLSASWSEAHSVYRTFLGYIRSLRPKYHVTLFQLGGFCPPDPDSFDECHVLKVFGPDADLSRLNTNDFQVAYFPDVGMSLESIFLANRRIAPIQVCGVGHSVSTYGAQIDYYIAGADAVRPDQPEQDYSERLVLLPGMGVIHNMPRYKKSSSKFPLPPDPMLAEGGEILVNCLAFSQKLNHPYITALQQILARAKRAMRFRFYVATSPTANNDYVPFERALVAALGQKHVHIMPSMAYREYMNSLEEGHLTIDTYHFGGCNTIADALYLGLPTVTWEGNRWYNRIGSRMLRMIGLDDCVATTEEQYVDCVATLINDDAAREAVKRRVEKADLLATIFDAGDGKYLAESFDYLIEHHDQLKAQKDRSPIRIPRK